MGKNKNRAQAQAAPVTTTPAEAQAPAAPEQPAAAAPKDPPKVVLYTIAAPKRPLTGTHFGKSGNEATHKALCDAAAQHEGKLTWEQIMEVCKEQNHKSFATYALKRLKVITPVAA